MEMQLSPPKSLLKRLQYRLTTLEDNMVDGHVNNDQLARAGIYYATNEKKYRCAYCYFEACPRTIYKTLKRHTFSLCPISLKNFEKSSTLRAQSFREFKTSRRYYEAMSEQLANNGFFYYGKRTEMRCVGCKLIIIKLFKNTIQELHELHQSFFPNCKFVNVIPPVAESLPPSPSLSYPTPSAPQLCDLMQTPTTEPNKLYPVLNNTNEFNCNNVKKRNYNMDDDDNVVCKICFENNREICFLPCRHVCTCKNCAARCKLCCICRVTIAQRLEVYLQ